MDTASVSHWVQQEHNRRTEQINREAWKFEHIEQPARGRLKLATLLQRSGR